MILLASIREATHGDTRKAVGTKILVHRLQWDQETLERVAAHLDGKGLVTLSLDKYVDDRRLHLTANGVEEVEWSLLHPADDVGGRSAWINTWLYVIDIARSLPAETVEALIQTLGKSSDLDESEIAQRVECVADKEVWAGLKRLLHDPAFGQSIPAWIGVVLTTLTLVQGCQQQQVSLEDRQRQTAILRLAVRETLDREAGTGIQRVHEPLQPDVAHIAPGDPLLQDVPDPG